jgi:hypothetical protein
MLRWRMTLVGGRTAMTIGIIIVVVIIFTAMIVVSSHDF